MDMSLRGYRANVSTMPQASSRAFPVFQGAYEAQTARIADDAATAFAAKAEKDGTLFVRPRRTAIRQEHRKSSSHPTRDERRSPGRK
jgi:hypothetical protein